MYAVINCTTCDPQEDAKGEALFEDTVITKTVASAYTPRGGGLSGYFATLDFSNVTITGCIVAVFSQTLGPFDALRNLSPFAAGGGGGLFLFGSKATFRRGSMVRFRFSRPSIKNCACRSSLVADFPAKHLASPLPQVIGNTASTGGGLYVAGANSTVLVTDASSLINNTATTAAGGGVYAADMDSFIVQANATVAGNDARTDGGGFSFTGVGEIVLDTITATSNR